MKNCFKAFKMLFKEFPLYVFLKLYKVINSVFFTLIPIHIINYISKIYNDKNGGVFTNSEIGKVILYVFICVVISFVILEISYLINLYEDYVERNFSNKLSKKFFKKIISLDYDLYETPEFLNDYMRSLEDGPYQIFNSANSLLDLLENLVTILILLGLIVSIHYSAIIYVFFVGILYFILRIFMSRINFKYHTLKRPQIRRARYSNKAFTLKDSIPDIKTTGIEEVLLDNNDKAYDEAIKLHKKYISKRTILNIIGDTLMELMYPGMIALITIFSMDNFKLEVFASLTIAATSLSNAINHLAGTLGSLQDAIVEAKVPFELLKKESNIESSNSNKDIESFNSIEIKNVKFSYNDINNDNKNINYAINDISLKINKGEKIAIVGVNGAGKTTLVKLLLRLYDVNSGDIFYNDTNYKDINTKKLRNKVGAVFQDVEVFALTIGENILLRTVESNEDKTLIDEALKFSGLYDYVYSLPNNINTLVTKEFSKDGVIFSGGQKQRLAIARGYAQNYELFILDEPSSALDPLAEAKVYNNMLELGKNKTMVFISHRLTTTVNADKIYLFKDGKIIEEGTHQELINKDGLYKKMFSSQAIKYLGGNYEEK